MSNEEQPRIFTYGGNPPLFDVNPAFKEAIGLMRRQLDVLQTLARQTILIPEGSKITPLKTPRSPNYRASTFTSPCYVCGEPIQEDDPCYADAPGPRHETCNPFK